MLLFRRTIFPDVFVEKLKLKIARVYYNHGLFIATHPAPVITTIPIVKEVPVHRAVVRDDEFQSFKDSRYVFTHDDQNKSLGYMLQIIVHSTILTKIPECHVNHEAVTHILQQSNKMVELVRQFRSSGDDGKSDGQTFDDICFQVEDRAVSEVESSEAIQNVLPTFGCLLLAPGFLLEDHLGIVQSSPQSSVLSRIRLAAAGNLRDLLFGFPWKATGLSKHSVCSRKQTVTYALTLVFREYKPSFFSELRDYLVSRMKNLHNDTDIPSDVPKSSDKLNTASIGHIFLVWYSDRSYFADYAPLIFIYVVLLLYVYFSVRKLEMVKSKWGLALSACVTVAASLFMSIGLCVTIGLVMPTLNGGEVFPYLVVLIGFENVIVLTKSVVATPVDLPVKYRIAEGLSKESWSLTKLYLTGLLLLGLGFFTFHPTMQEFCLFAVVGLTTDFFLQLFFFVTILSVDIRRMELSDLMLEYPVNSIIQEPQMLPPFYSTSPSSSSAALSSMDIMMTTEKCKSEIFCKNSLLDNNPLNAEGDKITHKPLSYLLSLISNICFMSFKSTKQMFLPSGLSFVKRHRRKVSAAQTAAYLASDGQTSQNVPRRLRVLRCWAKSRLIQRVLMLIFTVWIIVFLMHAVDIFQLFFKLYIYAHTLLSQHSLLKHWLNLSSDITSNTSHSYAMPSLSLDNNNNNERAASLTNSNMPILPELNASFISSAISSTMNSSIYSEEVQEYKSMNNDHVYSSTTHMLYLDDPSDNDSEDSASFNQQELNHHFLEQPQSQEHHPHHPHDISSSIVNADIKSQMNILNIPNHLQLSGIVIHEKFTWDTMFIWNYLAYYHWPLLAKHYNLSLVGCHLALLEPVHLKHKFYMIKSDNEIEKSDMKSDQEPISHISVEQHERILDVNNLQYINDNMLLSREKTSRLRASSTSPGGFAGWTARLGLTASMLGTSLLGCSLVLLLTCLGMVCLQSKSSNSVKREPIIRVLPLTIDLLDRPADSGDSEHAQNYSSSSSTSSPEWTVTCGQVYYKNKDGFLYSRGLLAVTSVRSYIQVKSHYSKVIQLWCTNSGNLLNDLNRYSESAIAKRKSLPSPSVCRKFSTVWCMDFLSQGLLVVGCSDGTIEIWNCESGLLIDILCLKQTNSSSTQTLFDKEIKESFDSPKRLHPGGITVMRIIDETKFCVGTSCGIVAYFHLAYPKGSSFHISSISCQWHVHTRAVTQLDFLKYFNKCIIENHNDLPDMNSNDIGVIVISGSEDGCIKFCSSEYDSPLLFHCEIDTTPVLSMALNHFALGVSHASGSLYVCYLDLLVNTTTPLPTNHNNNINHIINNSEDKCLIKPLEIRLVELTFLSNGGFGIASTVHHQHQQQPIVLNSGQSKRLSRRVHPGSIYLQLFTRINADDNNNEYFAKNRSNCNKLSPSSSSSLLANYRLVTYDMDGTVVIWDLQAKCMIRSFKANVSTFNMSNLLLSVGGRVVFGDQSYLRVVNPWTAKYERSVQLLPPSSVNMRSSNSSRLSALLRQWTKELVPLGVTGGDFKSYKSTELYLIANQQSGEHMRLTPINLKAQKTIPAGGSYVISIADSGRTLVVVPVSTI